MNELKLEIVLGLDKSSVQSVKSALAELQELANTANKPTQGGASADAPIKKTTDAIKAQVSALRRKVNLAEADFRLGKLSQDQLIKTTQEVFKSAQAQGVLGNEIDRNGTLYKSLSQSQLRAQQGFKGVGDESRRANFALINLGRIIQDLPFGFLGISNNIDPALTSMRDLNQSTGGIKGTFQELMKVLKGPGGLIFLFGSILPTVMLISQTGMNRFAKSTNKAKSDTEILTEQVKNFISETTKLRDSNGFSFLNQQNVKTEIEQLEKVTARTDEVLDLFGQANVAKMQLFSTASRGDFVPNVELLAITARDATKSAEELEAQFGFTQKEAKTFNKELKETVRELKFIKALADLDPLAKFRESISQETSFELSLFNTGLIEADDRLRALAGTISGDIFRLRNFDQDLLDELGISDSEVRTAIEFLQQELDKLSDFVPKKPIVEALLPKDVIIDNMNDIMAIIGETDIPEFDFIGFEDDLFKQTLDTNIEDYKEFQQQLTTLLSDGEEERLREYIFYQEIQKGLRKEMQDVDKQVANSRVVLERNVLSALTSLSQAFAESNKGLALTILAVEKGIGIAKVVIDGIANAAKATALGNAYLASSITPFGFNPQAIIAAGNAFKQAGIIKTLTALNVAAIAGQGIGEAANILNRGSRSSTSGGGSGSTASQQQGFFTTTEPKRPKGEAPIFISLMGDLDPEFLSVKVEKGNKARKKGTIFIANNA